MSSIHKYYYRCDKSVRDDMDAVAEKLIPADCARVRYMDELYVTSSGEITEGSDNVFETPHVDGPFAFVPKHTLYRCVYAVKGSPHVETHVNGSTVVLRDGDHVMFDYNRDPHHIVKHENNVDRVVYKLHFVKNTIRWWYFFAAANALWNTFARIIFLASIKPRNAPQRAMAWVINTVTSHYGHFLKKNESYN